MIVYLARDIRPFVIYCVNGKPRSSLLIESTDSMICRCICTFLILLQIDFPAVVNQKLSIIHSNAELQALVGILEDRGGGVFMSFDYCAMGCDIGDVPHLKVCLERANLNYCLPTLFISECVLTYVDPNRYVKNGYTYIYA